MIQSGQLIYYMLYISQELLVCLFKSKDNNYLLYDDISKLKDSTLLDYLGFFDLNKKYFKKNETAYLNPKLEKIFSIISCTLYTNGTWKLKGVHELNIVIDSNNSVHEHTQKEMVQAREAREAREAKEAKEARAAKTAQSKSLILKQSKNVKKHSIEEQDSNKGRIKSNHHEESNGNSQGKYFPSGPNSHWPKNMQGPYGGTYRK